MAAGSGAHRIAARLGRVANGFVAAGLGGGLFHLFGFPAAWVAGSTVGVVVATLVRVPIAMPARLREVVFVLLGISMGSGVGPETIARLPEWPVSLLVLTVTVIGVTAGAFLFFRIVAGWSWRTAFFAAIPGALSYVMAVAVETDADIRRVAIAQSIRLIILVVLLPLAIVGFGPALGPAPAPRHGTLAELLLLIAAGGAAGFAAQALRVPAGLLTGAFVASAILHASGVAQANLPDWLLIPSFLAIGVVIGVRFEGTDRTLLKETFLVALGGFAAGSAVSLAGALVVVWATSIGWGQALLAYAPGGLEAMTALAFALAVDPAYVATHQLVRFLAISLAVPAVIAALERRWGT